MKTQQQLVSVAAPHADAIAPPGDGVLEEFKQQVKLWMELDNQVKAMQQSIKQKREVQKSMTEKILGFMRRYNIEDLNTKDGKLRYRVVRVKKPVRQSSIKQRLEDYFDSDITLQQKVVTAVFGDEQSLVVEKPSLRRLKRSGARGSSTSNGAS
jgi:hypothetical protein